MLEQNISPRSVINRAYYAMFYSILSLFLKSETLVKTSKHTGVISCIKVGLDALNLPNTVYEIKKYWGIN